MNSFYSKTFLVAAHTKDGSGDGTGVLRLPTDQNRAAQGVTTTGVPRSQDHSDTRPHGCSGPTPSEQRTPILAHDDVQTLIIRGHQANDRPDGGVLKECNPKMVPHFWQSKEGHNGSRHIFPFRTFQSAGSAVLGRPMLQDHGVLPTSEWDGGMST